MTSVRLPKELEQKLDSLAEAKNCSRSAIIKEALMAYVEQEENLSEPFIVGEPLFGNYGSGTGGNSVSYKAKLRDKLARKHNKPISY
ncbi:MAG: ribbon-helix-helix domain-containing protein [Candidatus Cyclonatronum sp.]|uniref:CopG family ribbon-helix-helix protein n=1 Tax=Cyclonatronum sp. TaxID=3024185 RepID=UPI0025B8BA42|nr:ribbon-helix-helix domain-containing protein [Cyclonatronum sp.]MCC5934255.1 ribbon-helix-helix protein, CopG family [Balneolales bacterium]MCH8485344.1 ribbon-helix-helix domain-containing protein [Cyclonatronum sp.]